MKLKDFIKKLQNIKPELQDKHVYMVAQNGLVLMPEVKFELKDKMKPLELSKENVECIILCVE